MFQLQSNDQLIQLHQLVNGEEWVGTIDIKRWDLIHQKRPVLISAVGYWDLEEFFPTPRGIVGVVTKGGLNLIVSHGIPVQNYQIVTLFQQGKVKLGRVFEL